jgi:hypothetical protein
MCLYLHVATESYERFLYKKSGEFTAFPLFFEGAHAFHQERFVSFNVRSVSYRFG